MRGPVRGYLKNWRCIRVRKIAVLSMVFLLLLSSGASFAEVKEYKDFKLAAVFQTAIEEPWDGAIHQACLKLQKEVGLTYEFAEKVAAADFERVLREYAERDFDLIVGDAFLAGEEPSRRVAQDYPEVAFAFGSEFTFQEPNYSVFDNWIHEPSYLCGVMAGRLTKSNILGIVAAIPIAEVNRLVNAFKEGALSVNPDVKVKVAYIGSWFDPPKAKEATLAQIEAGADLIFAERFGVFEAAKEHNVLAFGNMQDQHDLAPEVVITGPVWDMYPTVLHSVDAVRKGEWKAADLRQWSMMAEGGAFLASFHQFKDKLPPELMDEVRGLEAKIQSGKLVIPIVETELKTD